MRPPSQVADFHLYLLAPVTALDLLSSDERQRFDALCHDRRVRALAVKWWVGLVADLDIHARALAYLEARCPGSLTLREAA